VKGRGRQATSNLDHATPRQACVPPGCKEYLPNYLLSVQMHEDKVELYTLVQMHMREVAGLGFAQGLFQEI